MPFPAARVGDPMTHPGGVILPPGAVTVLIGGQPAARATDMIECPLETPMVPPIPHVGGPIMPPCSTCVLIEGLPAARQLEDFAFCVGLPGVPNPIMMGCPTVLIGP